MRIPSTPTTTRLSMLGVSSEQERQPPTNTNVGRASGLDLYRLAAATTRAPGNRPIRAVTLPLKREQPQAAMTAARALERRGDALIQRDLSGALTARVALKSQPPFKVVNPHAVATGRLLGRG
jgi:hypothetical protein